MIICCVVLWFVLAFFSASSLSIVSFSSNVYWFVFIWLVYWSRRFMWWSSPPLCLRLRVCVLREVLSIPFFFFSWSSHILSHDNVCMMMADSLCVMRCIVVLCLLAMSFEAVRICISAADPMVLCALSVNKSVPWLQRTLQSVFQWAPRGPYKLETYNMPSHRSWASERTHWTGRL